MLQEFQGSYQLLQADLSQEADVKNAISTAKGFFGDQVKDMPDETFICFHALEAQGLLVPLHFVVH